MGVYHLLKKNTLTPAADTKVLKAAEYAQLVRANEIIRTAELEAESIRQQALEAFEKKKQEGFEQGVQEGKMEASMQMIDTVSQTVGYLESMEGAITETVFRALRKILGEIDEHELVVRIVKNALAVMRNQQQVVVRVSPDQVETVRESYNAILDDYSGVSVLDITPDPRLSKGGCILESELGVVDASLETQLEAIKRALMQRIKS